MLANVQIIESLKIILTGHAASINISTLVKKQLFKLDYKNWSVNAINWPLYAVQFLLTRIVHTNLKSIKYNTSQKKINHQFNKIVCQSL